MTTNKEQQQKRKQEQKQINNKIIKIIGHNIRRIRLLKAIKQKDLANYLGVSFQQLQKYEIGKNRVSADTLYKLSWYFDVPYASFFVGISAVDYSKQKGDFSDLSEVFTDMEDKMTFLVVQRFSAIEDIETKKAIASLLKALSKEKK